MFLALLCRVGTPTALVWVMLLRHMDVWGTQVMLFQRATVPQLFEVGPECHPRGPRPEDRPLGPKKPPGRGSLRPGGSRSPNSRGAGGSVTAAVFHFPGCSFLRCPDPQVWVWCPLALRAGCAAAEGRPLPPCFSRVRASSCRVLRVRAGHQEGGDCRLRPSPC